MKKLVFLLVFFAFFTDFSFANAHTHDYEELRTCLRDEDKEEFDVLYNKFNANMEAITNKIIEKKSEIVQAKKNGQYGKIDSIAKEIGQIERSYGIERSSFHDAVHRKFYETNKLCFD